ncbi:LOW QUALITY PROTEIN: dynein axonemal heavy chain 14 [Bufo gargarizans]|uniref:LOW QUALITY PROTEIN: dynein axonemal heavy chain 14 n=1 Tax=Bufo gargarizans TaxID=30331 RepID=UPI001CF15937|nr:LOW QUALITY PROTEIN: dynein axonemal heavy chain 14 [Bufo gargarizans]
MMYPGERSLLPRTDLRSRLHLGAESSDVLQMVSRNTRRHRQAVGSNEHSHTPGLIPKPPPGSLEPLVPALRTTVCRQERNRRVVGKLRDYRKEPEIKHRREAMSSGRLEDTAPSSASAVRPTTDLQSRFEAMDRTEDVMSHIQRVRAGLGGKTPQFELEISKADKYRRLLKENTLMKEDTGEFVYCLPRCQGQPTARYDPYDLQVVPAYTAVQCDVYWTVSASYVSKVMMVSGAEIMEAVPVTEWLCEREKYYAIKNIRTFSQFRLWKAFTVWKRNVHRSKMDSSKALLLRHLFLADGLFQDCLLYLQTLCEGAVNVQSDNRHGDLPILLVNLDHSCTYSLKDFCHIQNEASDNSLKKLQTLREMLLKVIAQTLYKVAEAVGLKDPFLSTSPTKPNYTEKSEWRNLQERFRRFLSLVDCLFQEMLRSVASNAVQMLLKFLEASSHVTSAEEKKKDKLRNAEDKSLEISDKVQQMASSPVDISKVLREIRENKRGKQEAAAVFEVRLVLHSRTEDKQQLSARAAAASHDPPGGKKQVTFEEGNEDYPDSEECVNDGKDEDSPRRSSAAAPKTVLVFPPNTEFEIHIQGLVDGFEQTIGRFSPLSEDPCFSKFFLQPTREKKAVPDRQPKWSQKASWPNCELLLGMDSDYQRWVKSIFSVMKSSMEEVDRYSSHFTKFCTMVEAAENVKVKISSAKVELSPDDYRGILATVRGFIQECQHMDVERRVLNIKVRSLDLQTECLQHLQEVVDIIHRSLPAMAYTKNSQLLEVIHTFLQRLNRRLTHVEEFVEHLTFLGQISSELPSLERQYTTVIQLYAVARDYGISVPSEETALYQSLIPSFQQLKSAVLFCEAKKDEDIVKFSGDLDKYISDLHFHLMEFKIKVTNPILLEADTFPLEANEVIINLLEEFEVIANKARCYSSYQERFGSSMTQMKVRLLDVLMVQKSTGSAITTEILNGELSEIECDLGLRKLLWEAKEEWWILSTKWRQTSFENLNVDFIQRDVNRFSHTLFVLEKGLPPNEVVMGLKQSITDFKQSLPIVVALRNPCLHARHWEVIHFTIGRMITKDKNFTLGNLLELRIFQHKDKIIDISTTATNEATLEGMLSKVIGLWSKTDFKLTPHKSEISEILIIATAEDITAQLEECQVILATVKGSRYCAPIKNTVDEWDRKLSLFSRAMEEWMTCQRNWLYLEQIFLASDIQRQLPAEAKLFAQVDSSWKELMNQIKDRPNALRAATAPGVLEVLQTNNGHLEKILKCLEDFLEIKRRVFPRFYFLSNDDLLSILAGSKNPNVIQPHLVKCFENIQRLDIKHHLNSSPEVETIVSAEGERICMPKNVRVRGSVEQWLGNVETSMYDVVKKLVRAGVLDWGQSDFKKWILAHPGQVILVVSQIMFSKDCLKGFDSADPETELKTILSNLEKRLGELAELAVEVPLLHQKRTLEALLILYVHCRDVLTELLRNKVFTAQDFEWTRQLRYEWNKQNNSCYVVQAGASFMYGYEYLGCSSRLVITPLTDRCWLTLTGALDLHLGGSPAGPAGTGKTETVKDLAKALGKQCVVFNCSESLDYKMMGKFFSGMAQSGAWCCFDEFNRIDIEVLSVIASQIHAIKTAKDSQAIRFVFEGREIRLNMSCGVFITMNPRYKGRVELPDNLKSLFRPVAMMVPDYQLISEIMLFSEGFQTAKSLSGKLVNLYQLASKQLSQQNHYDFGMRAIKTVLMVAGQKKQDLEAREQKTRLSPENETVIIICALKEANLPKFLAEDVVLFENIMADLFPGVSLQKENTEKLEKAVSAAVSELCLQPWESQMEKVVQFYHQILARHGVMLVGPTGGGKTTVRRILEKALTHFPPTGSGFLPTTTRRRRVETFLINPKCVTLGELYGEINPNTMEWSDGLLASAVRTFTQQSAQEDGTMTPATSTAQNKTDEDPQMSETANEEYLDGGSSLSKGDPDWYWIILDGPVDTLWVENLNTVLDDTRTLCLANSERIRLPQGMRMIFEVDSLAQASPATVSRCAMVYMDPVDLGWRPFVKTWLKRISTRVPTSGVQYLSTLLDKSVDEGIRFIRKLKGNLPFPVQDLVLVMNLCKILEAFIEFMSENGGFGQTLDDLNEKVPPASDNREFRSASESRRSYTPSLTESLRRREEQKWFLEKHPEKLAPLLGKLYIFAFTWAFGGVLTREDEHEGDSLIGLKARDEALVNVTYDFNSFVHDLFEGEQASGVQIPLGENSVFSYFVDLQTGNFVSWESLVLSTESVIHKESLLFSEPLKDTGGALQGFISTVDSVRYSFLTSLLLLHKQPVLLTGDSGVGKSTLVQNMLEKLQKPGGLSVKAGTVLGDIFLFNESRKISLLQNISTLTSVSRDDEDSALSVDDTSLTGMIKDGHTSEGEPGSRRMKQLLVSSVQLGPHTSAARIQGQILSKLVKKGRDTLGAPRSKQVAIFIDDLNMPNPEEYGSQPPLEMMRQFLELGGFYDTKSLTWKDIQDTTVIAACAPPGGGRSDLSPRLLKYFCMLTLPHPSVQALQHIFQVQLGSFLLCHNFLAEIQKCRSLLSSCAIAMYYRTCHSMLPTPAKCHYTFNLRDLFKVLQGLFQASESITITKDMAAQLLVHETTRVFHDRLVDAGDREIFYQCLSEELLNYFKISWPMEKLMKDPVQFVDFLEVDSTAKNRVYRPVTSHKQLVSKLDEYRMKMRMSSASTGDTYVFFTEAIQHIIRAARVFRQPGGHMMMVGLDGTGKVSCAALACYISNCKLFRLSVTQGYSHTEFREDLQKVYKEAGLLGRSAVLLIQGSDIVQDSFLEDINCVLSSGDVPDLFDKDELDGLLVELKAEAAEANMSDNPQSMLSFFLKRVRYNLHVVLVLSPAGQTFREHCRTHPSLVNCCTIDWYDGWPQEALLSVAETYMAQQDLVQENQGQIAQVCVAIHKSVSSTAAQYQEETRRRYYVTPQSYLSFIGTFSHILQTKKQKLMEDRDRFFTGLSKLLEATSSIEIMQQELVTLGPQIEQKSKEIEELMVKLQKDSAVVEQVRAIVQQEEDVMVQETRIVQEYAEQAQQELSDVLPALEDAVSALDSLDKADISEVKVYTHPPFLVLTVMNAVCVLLHQKPDWPTAKLLLGDPGFLKKLVNLNKDSIPEKVFSNLKKYSSIPDFNPQKVGAVSTACRSLCQWVLALEHYHEVQKTVIPKQERVAEAQEALKLAQERLKQKQASLSMVEEHKHLLQKQYNDSVAEKDHLAFRKQLTTKRLARASVLITALDEEKVRWKQSVERLELRLKGILGDVLVSAAFIVYGGVFTSEYRAQLMGQWLEFCKAYQIPVSEDYSFIHAMAAESEVSRWHSEGLPPDPYSIENAILVKNGQRWPLLIDPHGQAYKWIFQMEGRKLRQVQASDPGYMKTLETAIRLGEPILIQDVPEDMDPSLKPVVGREIHRRAGQDVIRLGDSEIEYNRNFRLYVLPAVCIAVTLINFTVTFKGLQDQLLCSVVTHEQPHLEAQRYQILESIAADLSTLRGLEEQSLTLLQKTEGHLLDDEDLINTLQKSKFTAKDVFKRMRDSGKTEASIEAARGIYLPVAQRGAVLYFVVADLIHLNYMYQFSLQWFHQVFVEAMKASATSQSQIPFTSSPGIIRPLSRQRKEREEGDPNEDIERHLDNICKTLTRNVYQIVSTALLTEHRLCFSFMLTVNIMKSCSNREESAFPGFLPESEWEFFLHSLMLSNVMKMRPPAGNDGPEKGVENKANTAGLEAEVLGRGTPEWLSDTTWRQCQYMSHYMEPFSDLCHSLSHNTQQWREFRDTAEMYDYLSKPYTGLEKGVAPGYAADQETSQAAAVFHWETLTSFQKLLLIKVLHPECLVSGIQRFIAEKMGAEYIHSRPMNLKQALDESSPSCPLIFILSPGSDPSGQLERLALETHGSTLHLDMISLGRGQGVKAEELITKARRLKGHWVFLQNCHLAASFMPRLREIVDGFERQAGATDPQFRLWLSSKSEESFPVSILQKGFKMAVEPPMGLKGKLQQTFDSTGSGLITEKIFEKENGRPAWKKLLFSLCLFNAVINERRKYGALGWNIPYDFTLSDLEVSVQMLEMLTDNHREIPWTALRYLTGEVVYGGRVTDSWDRRCLLSILDNFYTPALLQDDYSFSADQVYHPLSEDATLQDCRDYVNSLPDTDNPEIFGMHPNAERAYLTSHAHAFLDTIASMQSRRSADHAAHRSEYSQDQVVQDVIANILTKLPETVEGKTSLERSAAETHDRRTLANLLTEPAWETLVKNAKGYDPLINSALLTILRQEIDRFNHLLSVMHSSLRAVQQAIRGEVILNRGLEDVYGALASLKVPALWQQCSYESCKLLGSWVDDLVQRLEFFASWSRRVIACAQERFGDQLGLQKKTFRYSRPNSSQKTEAVTTTQLREEPSSFWLPAFFFPQGFLTAVLQNYARIRSVSVDSLTFRHQVQPVTSNIWGPDQSLSDMAFDDSSPPQEGILVFGLFLDSAQWNPNTQVLEECEEEERFYPLPQIHFIPYMQVDTAAVTTAGEHSPVYVYECPLYRTPQRAGTLSSTGHSTNFITSVTLPSLVRPNHWIRRGAALLCQIPD